MNTRTGPADLHTNPAHAFVMKLRAAMTSGADVTVRGSATKELLHQRLTITRPLERAVVIPHRGNDIFAAIAETMWVLAGRNDLLFLQRYLPRAGQFSDDGTTWRAGYGPRIRNWRGEIDQLREVAELLRRDRSSRRAVVSLFDPELDFRESQDVPCTNWLQFTVREDRLDLSVVARSTDLVWGFSGINSFEWSVLQEIVAHWVGANVGVAEYYIGSLHVYDRHFARAWRIIEASATADLRPKVDAVQRFKTDLEQFDETLTSWMLIEDRIARGGTAEGDISTFPDPLFRDFLRMLSARWASKVGDMQKASRALDLVEDLALAEAGRAAIRGTVGGQTTSVTSTNDLRAQINEMHRDRTAMYGDSWKRRGEMLGIMANIARKIDRLERWVADPVPVSESISDTSVDLFVYCLKYLLWLDDELKVPAPSLRSWSDGTGGFEFAFARIEDLSITGLTPKGVATDIIKIFMQLELSFDERREQHYRRSIVEDLVVRSWSLVRLIDGGSA